MKLAQRLFRERTRATTRETITFNAPGVYKPPYGKTVFELEGRGASGNPPTPGTLYYNPSTGGNRSYNPYYPGYNYTNPPTPGTYAGWNPLTPGTIARYNPPTPGNLAGYNPDIPGNMANIIVREGYYSYVNGGPTHWHPGYTEQPGTTCPAPWQLGAEYGIFPFVYSCTPGNYNAPVPGNPNYNPTVPGNAIYNPTIPGNPYYNPTIPGNSGSYNPTGGNAYTNPTIPGNPTYNPTTSGYAGTPSSVLGIPLPGGAVGTAAPVVGYVPIQVDFSNEGIPITVPSGGYVKIKNS